MRLPPGSSGGRTCAWLAGILGQRGGGEKGSLPAKYGHVRCDSSGEAALPPLEARIRKLGEWPPPTPSGPCSLGSGCWGGGCTNCTLRPRGRLQRTGKPVSEPEPRPHPPPPQPLPSRGRFLSSASCRLHGSAHLLARRCAEDSGRKTVGPCHTALGTTPLPLRREAGWLQPARQSRRRTEPSDACGPPEALTAWRWRFASVSSTCSGCCRCPPCPLGTHPCTPKAGHREQGGPCLRLLFLAAGIRLNTQGQGRSAQKLMDWKQPSRNKHMRISVSLRRGLGRVPRRLLLFPSRTALGCPHRHRRQHAPHVGFLPFPASFPLLCPRAGGHLPNELLVQEPLSPSLLLANPTPQARGSQPGAHGRVTCGT